MVVRVHGSITNSNFCGAKIKIKHELQANERKKSEAKWRKMKEKN